MGQAGVRWPKREREREGERGRERERESNNVNINNYDNNTNTTTTNNGNNNDNNNTRCGTDSAAVSGPADVLCRIVVSVYAYSVSCLDCYLTEAVTLVL